MENEDISVIIPAYNEGDYIGRTLDSVVDNTLVPDIVVVCDSCEDNTRKIAEKYTSKVYDVDFRNIGRNRNFGVTKTDSSILAFLGADTTISKNYFQRIKEYMQEFDYGVAKLDSESKKLIAKYVNWTVDVFNRKNRVFNGNCFMTRNAFEKKGGFSEGIKTGEDTDLAEKMRDFGFKHVYARDISQVPSERKYRESGYFKRWMFQILRYNAYMLNKLKKE